MVVGGSVTIVVGSGGEDNALVGKVGTETGDFGILVGDLSKGKNANAEASEGEDDKDKDDGEKLVFWLVDFGF